MPKSTTDLTIFIPTRGRINRQITAKNFCVDNLPWPVYRVVPECETDQWSVPKLVVPDSYKFSDIRQFILSQDAGHHLVMDDDLTPALRREDDPTKFISWRHFNDQEKLEQTIKLLSDMVRLMEAGWVHGGVSPRQGGNYCIDRYRIANREMRLHFYNAGVVQELGYDFRRVVIKQDLDFTLWMLRQGIPNILINHCVQDQSGNNVDGGCSRYRDEALLEQGSYDLALLHPEFVEVVRKTPKTAWGGNGRIDVNIRWKAAYKEGLRYVSELQERDSATLDDKDRTILRLQFTMQVLPNQ